MSDSEETLRRLRSARGHLDAVIRMVENDRYCIDVLHQIRAVQGALDRSRRALLDAHLRTCVADAYATGAYDPVVTELLDAMLDSGSPRPRAHDPGACAHAATVDTAAQSS